MFGLAARKGEDWVAITLLPGASNWPKLDALNVAEDTVRVCVWTELDVVHLIFPTQSSQYWGGYSHLSLMLCTECHRTQSKSMCLTWIQCCALDLPCTKNKARVCDWPQVDVVHRTNSSLRTKSGQNQASLTRCTTSLHIAQCKTCHVSSWTITTTTTFI